MISATNDITGDRLISRANSDKFKDNFDRIFGKKEAAPTVFKDRVKLGVSPSTSVENWDCRAEVEKAAESLLNLKYDGNKIEPII
tara:strand:- start:795 stop:1049 length:255 start_codon:yes stop_codon:yes gene_type:complete